MRRAFAAALFSLLLVTGRSEAQKTLQVVGDTGDPAAVRLREIVGRGGYRVLDRDTVLDAASIIPGDLVVAGADVRVEGRIEGSVAVLPGGEFFLRPGARVGGSAVVLGGGLFLSANATAGERLELPASVGTRLEREGDAYTLTLTPPPGLPAFAPAGVSGFLLPTYDRVNGATVRVGALARLGTDSVAPTVRATFLYHVARARPGAQLQARLPMGRNYIVAEAARTTRSPDRWIRDDVTNSAAALLVGSDARNYHESERVALAVGRVSTATLDPGGSFLAPRLRVEGSRDRSLDAREVWSLFGGGEEWRRNPGIDEGTVVSLLPGAEAGWRGTSSAASGDVEVEWAPAGLSDHEFVLLTVDARWSAMALWGHTIGIRGRVRRTLDGAPRQRWSLLGGAGTLPTFETGTMWGDQLLFLESVYSAPVPEVVLPLVGSPAVVVRHAVGRAWVHEEGAPSPALEQNLGLGLAFSLVRASADVDPTDPGRIVVSVAASLPF